MLRRNFLKAAVAAVLAPSLLPAGTKTVSKVDLPVVTGGDMTILYNQIRLSEDGKTLLRLSMPGLKLMPSPSNHPFLEVSFACIRGGHVRLQQSCRVVEKGLWLIGSPELLIDQLNISPGWYYALTTGQQPDRLQIKQCHVLLKCGRTVGKSTSLPGQTMVVETPVSPELKSPKLASYELVEQTDYAVKLRNVKFVSTCDQISA